MLCVKMKYIVVYVYVLHTIANLVVSQGVGQTVYITSADLLQNLFGISVLDAAGNPATGVPFNQTVPSTILTGNRIRIKSNLNPPDFVFRSVSVTSFSAKTVTFSVLNANNQVLWAATQSTPSSQPWNAVATSNGIESGAFVDITFTSIPGNTINAYNVIVTGTILVNWCEWGPWGACTGTGCSSPGGSTPRVRVCQCPNPLPSSYPVPCTGSASLTKSCTTPCCPVNGGWSMWTTWDTCTASCGPGVQSGYRYCDNPAPSCGGLDCIGEYLRTEFCSLSDCCPENGGWGAWSDWGACSNSCGSGYISRYRQCDSPMPTCGGSCDGYANEELECAAGVQDGAWGGWSGWTSCSKTCQRGGQQQRSRVCNSPPTACGGAACVGNDTDISSCNENVCCPVNGDWTKWSAWGPCSTSCGSGVQGGNRTCTNPDPSCGGLACIGDSQRTKECNQNTCCPVNGDWTVWSAWGPCSTSCGSGVQGGNRTCTNPDPSCGGLACIGDSQRTQECNQNTCCPVNGIWSMWSAWGSCSTSCGPGAQQGTRTCTNPAPACGGLACNGDSQRTQTCNANTCCPVHGIWSQWSTWSSCSTSCGPGVQGANRTCTNPSCGGLACSGDSQRTQVCNENTCCPVNGNWTQWSIWTSCSTSCGPGVQSANRTCTNPAPSCDGLNCNGMSQITQSCGTYCCAVNGVWGAWGSWGACGSQCGNMSRSRTCNNPPPSCGGVTCPGSALDSSNCLDPCCQPGAGQCCSGESQRSLGSSFSGNAMFNFSIYPNNLNSNASDALGTTTQCAMNNKDQYVIDSAQPFRPAVIFLEAKNVRNVLVELYNSSQTLIASMLQDNAGIQTAFNSFNFVTSGSLGNSCVKIKIYLRASLAVSNNMRYLNSLGVLGCV